MDFRLRPELVAKMTAALAAWTASAAKSLAGGDDAADATK
jgi:hypothetical protein